MAAAGISIATLLRMSGAGAADDPALDLYTRYGAQLFRFCRRLAADADVAEDAVQATVLEAARLLAAGFRPEFESAWLFSLAQRHATDGAPRPTANRLSALASELRGPLALRLEGRTYAEIAETLGVARGAIELRVLRARIAAQRRSRLVGDLASLGGALKALLAGGAAVPATVATVATVGAVAVVPRLAHRNHPPARSVPAVVVPTNAPAPVAASPVRDSDAAAAPTARTAPRVRTAAHPPRKVAPASRPAPTHPHPTAAAPPVAAPSPATEPSQPVAAPPAASLEPAPQPPPAAPSSSAPAAATPAPAPAAVQPPVPAPVPASVAVPEPVAPAPTPSVPALEPVTSSPVASDPVGTVTTVADQAVAAVPAPSGTVAAPAAPPLPKLP